jgi:hypothetical protein
MEQFMALHKIIVNNSTSQCLGKVSDGVLPSDLDSSVWSLQDFNYDSSETELEAGVQLIDYSQWETVAKIVMYFKDDQLTLFP